MLKSKTLWSAITAITASLSGYFLAEISLGDMLQIVVTSVLAVCLRIGVKKAEDAAESS